MSFSPFRTWSIRQAFTFWWHGSGDQRSTAWRKGEDINTLFCSHCVQSAEGDVEYQNDHNAEEAVSLQHSILVLHEPLCKWTAHLWYDHPCTSATFWSLFFGLFQMLMLCNTNALFKRQKKKKKMSDFMALKLYRTSWLHFNLFTFSVPLHLLEKPKSTAVVFSL